MLISGQEALSFDTVAIQNYCRERPSAYFPDSLRSLDCDPEVFLLMVVFVRFFERFLGFVSDEQLTLGADSLRERYGAFILPEIEGLFGSQRLGGLGSVSLPPNPDQLLDALSRQAPKNYDPAREMVLLLELPHRVFQEVGYSHVEGQRLVAGPA